MAQRSAAAAKDIKTLINTSVDEVALGTRLADQAGAAVQETRESFRRVTDLIGEITASSEGQATEIQQISNAVNQMDEVTQQNAALVEEAAAAAQSLKEQAGSLLRAVSIFTLDRNVA